jgi:large subunit ribosomal protein L33
MANNTTHPKLLALVSDLSGHRSHYTTKNVQNTTEKIVLKKYDPIARTHATYTETKKNLGRNEIKPRKS